MDRRSTPPIRRLAALLFCMLVFDLPGAVLLAERSACMDVSPPVH